MVPAEQPVVVKTGTGPAQPIGPFLQTRKRFEWSAMFEVIG